MDGMSELLFGRISGPLEAAVTVFSLVGVLTLCVGLALLARRHEAGWWLVAGSFVFSELAALLGQLNLLSLGTNTASSIFLIAAGTAVRLFLGAGIGIYGLLSFQKYPLTAPRLRGITLRRFRGSDLLAPLAVAVIFAVATMLPFLSWHASSTLILGPGTDLMAFFVSAVLLGLLPAGLLGLAHRSRWAWFLIVISTLVSIVGAVLAASGSVLIFLSIAVVALAIYGWGAWKSIPAQKSSRS